MAKCTSSVPSSSSIRSRTLIWTPRYGTAARTYSPSLTGIHVSNAEPSRRKQAAEQIDKTKRKPLSYWSSKPALTLERGTRATSTSPPRTPKHFNTNQLSSTRDRIGVGRKQPSGESGQDESVRDSMDDYVAYSGHPDSQGEDEECVGIGKSRDILEEDDSGHELLDDPLNAGQCERAMKICQRNGRASEVGTTRVARE